jgi:hypothetical protein
MERIAPRTLLERLIQEHDRTLEETCEDFERCAREMSERATLSIRQLSRWMSGGVNNARPNSRRVAQRLWGHTFEELLGLPGIIEIRQQVALQVGYSDVAPPSRLEEVARVGDIGRASEMNHMASLFEEIDVAAEESARFVRSAGRSVTGEMVEQLNSDVRRLAVLYLNRPPYAVFRSLAALRREVFGVIDSHPRPQFLPDLYRVAGQLSALLAHASSDLGQLHAADGHIRTAWLCADLAEDDSLRVYARWIQANVAYWREDYREAAELVSNARRFATGVSDMLRLTSQEARAWAAMRDGGATKNALALMSDAAEGDERSRPPGVFYFDAGKAAYYASEARLSLGGEANARQAVRDAKQSLAFFHSLPKAEQSLELKGAAQLDLVAAHLALGDLDAAGENITPVLKLPAENRTVPIMGRIGKIDRSLALETYRGMRLASDIREEIDLFSAYSAAREIPALPRELEQ